MRLFATLLYILICTSLSANAAIKRVSSDDSSNISAEMYEVIDISYVARERVSAPYDVELTAVFISPTGDEKRVAAIYNGSNEWIVRFSADESGEWSYTTSSKYRSLSGKSGLVTISKNPYKGGRGMVVKSKETPTRLETSDGSPYLPIAFGCDFLFALDYHNDKETPRLNRLLKELSQSGINHVMMPIYAYDFEWDGDVKLSKKPEYDLGGDNTIFPFYGSNQEPKHSTLNVEFFRRLDRTIEALNDNNITAQLTIYKWDRGVNWAKTNSAEDQRYFDYVVKRYQGFPNIIWDLSSGTAPKEADNEWMLGRINRLRKLDTFGRMVTLSDTPFCQNNSKAVDMISIGAYPNPMESLNADLPSISIDHGAYEECDYKVVDANYISASQCLRRSYQTLFGGVYATYYWQGASWSVICDLDSRSSKAYKPQMAQYKYLRSFFVKHPYNSFKPASELSKTSQCLRDSSGSTILIYVDRECYKPSIERIEELGDRVLFQWFNTNTGEYSKVKIESGLSQRSIPANPYHSKDDGILIVKILE